MRLFFRKPEWYPIGGGMVMYLDPADFMDCQFYRRCYDNVLLEVIKRFVRAGDLCVDVGAQKGYVALHLSKQVGDSGRVLAFEPDPRAREQLERNLARNQAANTTAFPWAVGESEGTATFHLSSQLGWSTRFPNDLAKPTLVKSIEVPIKPLTSVFDDPQLRERLSRLAFVKIDCEGSEPQALRGMAGILRETGATVWIEVNAGSLQAAGQSAESIRAFLSDLGYVGYCTRGKHPNGKLVITYEAVHDARSLPPSVTDLLFVKRDKSLVEADQGSIK